MDWTNSKSDADAIDRAVYLEQRLKSGEPSSFSRIAGLLNFGTFGNGHRIAALRNALVPDKTPLPATEDEFARLRQNDPIGYYSGHAIGALPSLLTPPLAALQTGAAIYNNPTVQRTARDFDRRSGVGTNATALMLAAPWALMHMARNALGGE